MFWERRCIRCGACVEACEQGAISLNGLGVSTATEQCVLCGACVQVCFTEARQIVGREMTVAQVMAEVERDQAFYDESGGGVTVSGGEPLMQPAFLRAFLQACRQKEIHTALDTCGHASWEALDSVRENVDLFLYDLKVIDSAEHRRFTGVSNERILSNLRMLSELGHAIVLRVPIIPGVNSDEETIRQLGAYAASLPGRHRVEILPYHHSAIDKYARLERAYALPEKRPPVEEGMSYVAQILRGYGLQVKKGG